MPRFPRPRTGLPAAGTSPAEPSPGSGSATTVSAKMSGMFQSLKSKAQDEDWMGKAKTAATQATATAQQAAGSGDRPGQAAGPGDAGEDGAHCPRGRVAGHRPDAGRIRSSHCSRTASSGPSRPVGCNEDVAGAPGGRRGHPDEVRLVGPGAQGGLVPRRDRLRVGQRRSCSPWTLPRARSWGPDHGPGAGRFDYSPAPACWLQPRRLRPRRRPHRADPQAGELRDAGI